ncbi:MAG: endopeptidase La, partial [Muribaculaceae bacterium]|nr:endopeptidase La [Muribaculaceae bacterium]
LRRYNPSSPDYSVLYSYLDTLLNLPWTKESPRANDLSAATETLETEHYGLEKVKERIIEQLAVMMHNPTAKAPIICLVGPPGVGKTSIGRSVAHALGRVYERVSFGGLHDEAEIRGHRRTYIGAMPGRIIDAMKRAGTVNPVLMLDEIDKIGADYKGDPAAALLEVLDPEQNCRFHDNYIDIDYDLSKVLFIATANTLSTIARPLLDRMEIIEVPGYLVEEKMEIGRRHLLPRICKELGFPTDRIVLSDAALSGIIRNYTAESGVRKLEKLLAKVVRKAILADMSGKTFPTPVEPEHLYDLLGLAPYQPEKYEGNEFAGVVTGLAWTEVGGEILMVESSLSKAKTPSLVLTGKLGDVMKESATIAYQWVQCHADQLGIDPELFEKYKLHIHFPEGAVPKDGPSAGITIATSIVSTFRQCRVAPRIAMTGEITLRGKVLPVGGIREKILAAKRAGIDTIILSSENRRNIEDIPGAYTEGITFRYVDTVDQVLDYALTNEPVANPVTL